jgi:hypothetical protein
MLSSTRTMRLTRTLLFLTILLALSGNAYSQLWSGIISSGRATDWSTVGAPDIADARTQCGSTIAAYGSSGSPAAPTTINNAIAACGANQYVLLGAGTFYLNAGITFSGPVSNVTLRGMGANQTFIIFTGNNACQGIYVDVCMPSADTNYWGGPSNLANWTAGYGAGTTSITLSSVTNLKVGWPLTLDQLDSYSQTFTSGWTNTGGNVWQVADTTVPAKVYFNNTSAGTQVASVAAVTSAGNWYFDGSATLYVYSTSNPGTAFTAPPVTAVGDTGNIFLCYTPQYVCSTNGDNGGGPRTGRSQQQIVTVTSISGSGPYTVGITPAVRMPNWASGSAPQAWWPTSPIFNDGIENLSMDHTNSGAGGGVGFFNCSGCWVKGVRSIDPVRSHVQMWQSVHGTVQDSYFFECQNPTSTSYTIETIPAADSLIQNNISQAIAGAWVTTGTCSGCVIAYNFDINNLYGTPVSGNAYQEQSMFPHAVGDENILIEGNQGVGVYSDNFHGTHHFQTIFRNNYNGFQPNGGYTTTNGIGPMYLLAYSRFYNVIGNVLGTSALPYSYYQCDAVTCTNQRASIYSLELGDEVPNDSNVERTLFRWGNYDTVTANVRWCGNSSSPNWSLCGGVSEVPSGISQFPNSIPSSTTLPASFYLSAKPSWWPSAKAWPPIGPDVSGGNISNLGGHAYTIPAADCYSTIGGPSNGTGSVLAFNAATCYPQQAISSSCTLSPGSIGPYTAGQSASQTFTAANCSSSTFTISSGSLTGSGLSLNSSTGVLSGTAAAGSFSFTVAYGTASDPISLTINAAPSITATTLPSATSGSAYSQTLATSGGTAPLTCTLMSGSLSGSGLGLNSNCTITGTALTAGAYSFAVGPTDSNGVSGSSQALSLSVAAATQDPPGTPTLVQHVATGMDQNPVGTLKITLPNSTGAGNALLLGVQFNSSGSISSIADNGGNTWVAGPTATNTSTGHTMRLYYALNVAGGTQTITVTFSGLGSVGGFPQAVVSEFYNVAQVSAADGSSSSSTSRTAGTITTAASGDLIYHWAADFSDTNSNGGAYNGSSIAAGAGFTLLSADLQVGSADQYQVQSSAGSINPTLTATGSATWGSVALALKSASAGTPPPSGIRIVHIQHTLLAEGKYQGRSTPAVMQFPSSGNLLVGLFNSPDYLITKVSDSASNTWVSAGSVAGSGASTVAQIVYAANASTSPTLSSINVTLGGSTTGGVMFDLYDVTGAATSPFDQATTAEGDQTSNGNLTTPSLTPSTANGLVFNDTAIDFHTLNGIVGSGYILDSVVNSLDNDAAGTNGTLNSNMDEDNGTAHIYNTSTGAVTFVYTATNTGTPAGVLLWGSITAAFIASSGGASEGTNPPTAVQATVH